MILEGQAVRCSWGTRHIPTPAQFLWCLVFVLVLSTRVFAPSAAASDKRIALVIGNSGCRNTPKLTNPKNAGLFFYAEHGLQVGGQNYLVPIDAKLTTAASVDFEMVRLDLVNRTMERETPTNILIIDACRDNPIARNLARAPVPARWISDAVSLPLNRGGYSRQLLDPSRGMWPSMASDGIRHTRERC